MSDDHQPQTYTINCAILGEITAFPVEIPSNEIVGRLKEKIKEKKPNRFRGVDADELTLYRVDISGSWEAMIEELKKLADDFGQREALWPLHELTEIYPTAPPKQTIHIIVQLPQTESPIVARGIRRKHDELDEVELSSPTDERASKRRRYSPPARPEKPEHRSPQSVHDPLPEDIYDRALALYNAIKNLDNDLDLSNPATFVMLPFPSLIPASVQRFQATKKNGVEYFRYMGRSKFTQIKECTQSNYFVGGSLDIYLYGSSGSGKSHILAALVCQLIREGKRVVYIPDCRDLLKNPYKTVWVALYCAFYDDPASLQTIKSTRDVEGLVKFWRTIRDRYLVVDQLNAFEIDPSHANLREAKKCLDSMSFRHRYIYSASANELSNREVDLKQAPIVVISLLGGMDGEETKQWFKHHSSDLPTLSNDDRQRVEYLTGRIPLLLRLLFEFKGKAFDEHKFLGCSDLTKVNKDVTKYFREKLEESQEKQARYFEIMEDCLQGVHISTDLKQYDLRYFYVDNQRGCYTCGVVFESMMLMFRERRFQQFNDTHWHVAVSETKNPVVQGVIAEQICLNRISADGLRVVSPSLTKMDVAPFHEMPAWAKQIDDGFTLRLHTPIDFNFASIDAIILSLNVKSKKAHLYPIQITLSRDHKNSEDAFYAEKWRSWVKPIEDAGFTVDSTFVWIDKKQPTAQPKETITVSTRQGVKFVQPEHQSIHVGIGQVSAQLARALSL